MAKKCIDCDAIALYVIKGTSEYYCQSCASENFSDVDMLVALEEEARALRNMINSKVDQE